MLPKWHALIGFVCLIILYSLGVPLFYSAIVFLASVSIDVDHYLFYVRKTGETSLKKAYRWHILLGRKHKPIMHLFHTLEFHLLILALSFFHPIFFFVLVGMLIHSFLDIFQMIADKELNTREHILIRYLLTKSKNPKKYLNH